ncbi:putative ferric-chelate reductase 1 isoform X1 [Styela clava]
MLRLLYTIFLIFLFQNFASAVFSTTGCGTTKGCQLFPEGCDPASTSCIFFSWTWNSASRTFDMEISGDTGGGSRYAAVAFGQVDDMQDADLYFCTGSSIQSGVIVTRRAQPTLLDIATEPGVNGTSAATNSGLAECTFARAASITKTITTGPKDFDLSTGTYYILLARGPMAGTTGNVGFHDAFAITANQVNMITASGSATGGADILEKVHGSLMIVAWMVLANVGAMIARHFKPLWVNTNPGGEKLWFQLHRLIMITVFLCTTTAFIIIFVHVGGYASTIPAHAIIGIIVMALTLINPILAIFRPHPNTSKRYLFNIFHYLIGLCARCLAIANLFQGAIAMDELSSWKLGVLGGFVGFEVLMELCLEALTWHYGHYSNSGKSKEKEDPPPGEMQMEEPDVGVRGQTVKTSLLVFFILGLCGFAIAFFVDIANA